VLCATILESSTSAILTRMAAASPKADLLEVRADAVAPGELDLGAILARRPRPVVFTCRPTREGGLWRGTEEERLALLRAAHDAGADWIDVEWDARIEVDPARVIVSRHDFEGALDIERVLASLRDRKARYQKLAVLVDDARAALALMARAAREARPTIAIAMGFPGVATRLMAERAGAPWTYAAAGDAAAPGQLALEKMSSLLAGRRVTRATRALGVLGRPVAHSRSPALMNAVFGTLGVDAVYSWLETQEPAAILAATRADPSWLGFSVTIPHKETAAKACDRLSAGARAVGAINTVARSGEEWVGHNTDALAVRSVLSRATRLEGMRADILGAGGAARAAAWALREAGAKVRVFDRTPERGKRLADDLGVEYAGPLASCRAQGPGVLVNATSVGMTPAEDASPVGPEAFGAETIALDLVYTPEKTRFLRLAEERVARTITGMEIFVAQARAQLELWLGKHVSQRVSDEWLAERARRAS